MSVFKSENERNYRYRDSWNSNNFRERAIKKEAKELITKRMQRGLRARSNREMSNIAIAILKK